MRLLLLALASLAAILPSLAQNPPGTKLHIKKAKGHITIDGKIDEPDWQAAQVGGDWFLNYPVDTARAPFQTEARLTFNDQYLYISFVCYDDESRDMINSLRRDFDYDKNDNVGVCIGPYNDHLNGFFFTITPRNIQMDGTVSGGGAFDDSFSLSWDNKWISRVERLSDRWTCEIAIPFKTLRYKGGLSEWNIAIDRLDKKRNMKSAWIHTPIQFFTGSFAYSGQLVWDDPVPPPHTNISLIPYVAGGVSRDQEAVPPVRSNEIRTGFDAKIGITPSLNLDLTVNPDFSQVEADQQIINLSRFEFRLPERRQFFIENNDLLEKAGFAESKVFFSRRVGLVADSLGLYRRIPIAYGARVSGSLSREWRVNVLSMRTKEDVTVGLPAQNYYVGTLLRNFWKQSSVSLTFVDKETAAVRPGDTSRYFHESVFRPHRQGTDTIRKINSYNRVLDADLRLLSEDNRWSSTSYLAKSFDPFHSDKTFSGGTNLQYSARTLYASIGAFSVGKNYNAETGYVPGKSVYPGFSNYSGAIYYKMYPQGRHVVFMGPVANAVHVYTPDGTLVDRSYSVGYNFNFLNTATLNLAYNYFYQNLTMDFNPISPVRYESLRAGEQYDWSSVMIKFQSNTRKLLNAVIGASYGGFYNGTNLNVNGDINWRYQPYGNVSLRFDYNDLRLADGYGSERLLLVGPKIDWTFSDKLFLTTYIQYNNLINNINLNARFQWRYKPASDFFIVYTENYIADGLNTRSRALIFKLNYWFNL